MALSPGVRLGPYEVLAPLGAGGMGEVFRARDTKLGRDVALKVLPAAFAGDPDRLMRFEREARTLATLNHPHIAQIYGLEEIAADGPAGAPVRALVMELVDGDDLSARIARGPLALDEALPIARQIADALEAAHEQGIIHRDLKPANIKVRPDGTVKVLDFGLAKALERHVGADTGTTHALANSPTITSPAMTAAGVILGTAAYMAPEQVKGLPADKRSDIWAFGCVLYEMLTGAKAFPGDDVADTLAAVLRAEPDWPRVPRSTPPHIERVIKRCLTKNRRLRLADIADARFDLEDRLPADATAAPTQAARRRSELIAWALAASALAVALMLWLRPAPDPQRDPDAVRFNIAPPARQSVSLRVTGSGGANNLPLAVSPDGRHLVMIAYDESGRGRLWLRSLNEVAARELPDTVDAVSPFWSPDSRYVGFYSGGRLKKLDINGGASATLCSVETFNAATWSPAGVIVIARAGGTGQGGALLKVSDAGGTPTPATELRAQEALHLRPWFLPDGRHFLYRVNTAEGAGGVMAIGSIDSMARETVPELASAGNAVYANGRILFMREATLMALPFDATTRRPTGEAVPITDDIQTSQTGVPVGVFTASQNGALVYQAGGTTFGSQLAWFNRQGTLLGSVGTPANYSDLEMAPDGRQASVSISDPRRLTRDVWVVDLTNGGRRQVTFDPATEQTSIWAPDGSRLIYNRVRGDRWELFEQPLSAGGAGQVLLTDPQPAIPWSWASDGHGFLYSRNSGSRDADVWLFSLPGRQQQAFIANAPADLQARFSPDGRWVSYVSSGAGGPEVYVVPFPGPGPTVQVSADGGMHPRWRRDGKELYYLRGRTLVAAAVSWSPSFRVESQAPLFDAPIVGTPRSNYDVSADGQRFLVNTPGPSEASPPVVVVLNWMSALTPSGISSTERSTRR